MRVRVRGVDPIAVVEPKRPARPSLPLFFSSFFFLCDSLSLSSPSLPILHFFLPFFPSGVLFSLSFPCLVLDSLLHPPHCSGRVQVVRPTTTPPARLQLQDGISPLSRESTPARLSLPPGPGENLPKSHRQGRDQVARPGLHFIYTTRRCFCVFAVQPNRSLSQRPYPQPDPSLYCHIVRYLDTSISHIPLIDLPFLPSPHPAIVCDTFPIRSPCHTIASIPPRAVS